MRLLLVTESPDRAATEPGSPAAALRDLGSSVTAIGFDLVLDEAQLRKQPPQVLLIDARERLETGYACRKRLRNLDVLSEVPALMAITLGRLPSLDVRAADDFVLVPIVPAELYARLRQLDWRFASFAHDERIKIGNLEIDLAGYEVHLQERKLELTHQEFELLRFLAQTPNKVFTREQLLAKVWGYRYYGGTRTVDIHVRRLRAKLGSPADTMIETVRNVGYKLKHQRAPG